MIKKLEKNNELPVRGPPVDWAGSIRKQLLLFRSSFGDMKCLKTRERRERI